MLRDRYESNEQFWAIIEQLVVEMDPELAQIDAILEDDALYQLIRNDLAQRYEHTQETGRPSTPVEVSLRMLAAKRLYKLTYRQTERYVSDSLVLRQFCRLYLQAAPDHTTLNRIASLIRPETLEAFNKRLTTIATELKITRGRKLRTDGTVVESNIAHPSDSKLLSDGVRVLSRVLKQAKDILQDNSSLEAEVFRDRTRSARKLARQISDCARRRGESAQVGLGKAYQRLLTITRRSVQQARRVLEDIRTQGTQGACHVVDTLETFIPRVEQVVDQTRRRVVGGEKVPASEKIVSLFEPHTALIRRGKAGKDTEFGRKVWLTEVEGGIVTHWDVLAGNPPDSEQWQPALDHHLEHFGYPPKQASADRGVYSPDNEAYAQRQGVKHVVLPQPGYKSEERRQFESQSWFKRGRRFHAGVEGRISVAKRKYSLNRCLDRGEKGFEKWVGWGIIAGNLTVMGRTLANRTLS